jgi:hypothetical protein
VLIAANPATDIDFHAVSLLPDGRFIVARHARSDDSEHLEIVEDGKAVALTDDRSIGQVSYGAPGVLLFVRRGSNKGVWAVPFEKPPIDFSRAVLLAAGATWYVSSADGTLVHFTSAPARSEFVWASRTGGVSPIPGTAVELGRNDLALSPDGRRAAFIIGDGNVLVVRDLQTGVDTRLTTANPNDTQRSSISYCPSWFPAGNVLTYTQGPAEATTIFAKDPMGVGRARTLVAGMCGQVPRDGRTLYYATDERGRGRLQRAPIGPDGTVGASSLLLPADDESDVGWFDLSADGTLLAYEVQQPNRQVNVWLTDVPNAAGRRQLTTDGGTLPHFSPNGRELFYLAPASTSGSERLGALVSVALTVDPALRLGAPQKLFTLDEPGGLLAAGGYDVAPDGRFLFSRAAASAKDTARAVLVENWMGLVRK